MRVPTTIPVGTTAQRPGWEDLPRMVRDGLDQAMGSPVVESRTQNSGFTPGYAARVRLADGRRFFVKAADRAITWMADSYAKEADVLAVLPDEVPAPRLHRRLELTDGVDAWLVLVLDDVAGRPPRRPWQLGEARATLAAVDVMARILTPAPVGPPWQRFAGEFWTHLGLDEPSRIPFPADIAAALLELLTTVPTALDGNALVHNDLRDDNVIVGDDGRIWICDWNWPTLGAGWIDAVCVAIAMVADGLDEAEVLAASEVLGEADPDGVDALLALLLGYFLVNGNEPEIDNSPHLRAHQLWYARATEGWLRHRRGW